MLHFLCLPTSRLYAAESRGNDLEGRSYHRLATVDHHWLPFPSTYCITGHGWMGLDGRPIIGSLLWEGKLDTHSQASARSVAIRPTQGCFATFDAGSSALSLQYRVHSGLSGVVPDNPWNKADWISEQHKNKKGMDSGPQRAGFDVRF